MTFKRFEDIEAWEKARKLSHDIYKFSSEGQFSKDFELRGQIRSASGSIMDNIAEGYERDGKKEFIYFLGISKGSAGEVKSQLYRAIDNNYINQEVFDKLYNNADEISKMIKGLIEYLKKSEYKGTKFKT
jgi:four helix bundle protein